MSTKVPFVPCDSVNESGRLAWLYELERRDRLTDGERREIDWLERRIFGRSRRDEENNRPKHARAAKGGE